MAASQPGTASKPMEEGYASGDMVIHSGICFTSGDMVYICGNGLHLGKWFILGEMVNVFRDSRRGYKWNRREKFTVKIMCGKNKKKNQRGFRLRLQKVYCELPYLHHGQHCYFLR